jgi:hypothetical protein
MDPANIRAILTAASFWAQRDASLPQIEEVCLCVS